MGQPCNIHKVTNGKVQMNNTFVGISCHVAGPTYEVFSPTLAILKHYTHCFVANISAIIKALSFSSSNMAGLDLLTIVIQAQHLMGQLLTLPKGKSSSPEVPLLKLKY